MLLPSPFLEGCPSSSDTLESVTLESDNPIFKEVLDVMEAIEKLPKLTAVYENITAVTRMELCLTLRKVDLNMVEKMWIRYRIEKDNIILQLKAILDTGSESIIGSEERLGKIITDGCKETNVLSVVNKKKPYKAR